MLKGKRAIVTGSTSGIGLAIAMGFAAEGCDVMLNGFGDAGEIERRRGSLAAEHGVRVSYNPADMTRPEQIRDLVAATAREFGGVDIRSTMRVSSTSPRSSISRKNAGTR
jgi:3-hydroxybutyrate dehydrogenase